MSKKNFDFIESNSPKDVPNQIPIIPIVINSNNNEQFIIQGLIDSGSNNSFIDVNIAKQINAVIIDNLYSNGIGGTNNVPVTKICISNESMEGEWIDYNAGIIDCHHPNIQIILGRDFMIEFNEITFDFKNKKIAMDYQNKKPALNN